MAKGVIGVEPRPGDRRSKRVVAFASAPGADQPDELTARLREISASLSSSDARLITAYLDRISESLQAQTRRRTH